METEIKPNFQPFHNLLSLSHLTRAQRKIAMFGEVYGATPATIKRLIRRNFIMRLLDLIITSLLVSVIGAIVFWTIGFVLFNHFIGRNLQQYLS